MPDDGKRRELEEIVAEVIRDHALQRAYVHSDSITKFGDEYSLYTKSVSPFS